MKIATIVGARPQFIKLAPLSEALKRAGHIEYAIHTGQHYDTTLSDRFYEELTINKPDINLNVVDKEPTRQLGRMIDMIGDVLAVEKPGMVVVFGDTTSTLAGALAANKMGIKLAHIEAGIRSYNRNMPEEHNRILTDHVSQLLLCPTMISTRNLINEAIPSGIFLTGDITYDSFLQHIGKAAASDVLQRHNLTPGSYSIMTVHRSYNLDNPYALAGIMTGIGMSGMEVVFPVHPHTAKTMEKYKIKMPVNVIPLMPMGYIDTLALEKNSRYVITDSGGMQKEAYWFQVPCITLRTETEWPETLAAGWNVLVGSDPLRINSAITDYRGVMSKQLPLFGDGNATKNIMDIINAYS
jgi:UDP-N-acetylglucosamine 2-epimerase